MDVPSLRCSRPGWSPEHVGIVEGVAGWLNPWQQVGMRSSGRLLPTQPRFYNLKAEQHVIIALWMHFKLLDGQNIAD